MSIARAGAPRRSSRLLRCRCDFAQSAGSGAGDISHFLLAQCLTFAPLAICKVSASDDALCANQLRIDLEWNYPLIPIFSCSSMEVVQSQLHGEGQGSNPWITGRHFFELPTAIRKEARKLP